MLRRPSRADWSSSTISSVALEALSVVCKLINSNLDIPQIDSAVRENGLAAFGRAAKSGQVVGIAAGQDGGRCGLDKMWPRNHSSNLTGRGGHCQGNLRDFS